jgi:hypothetical protein
MVMCCVNLRDTARNRTMHHFAVYFRYVAYFEERLGHVVR